MSQVVAFDIVLAGSDEHDLPKKIELRPSPSSILFLFAMLIPALIGAVIVPYFMTAYLAAVTQNFASFVIDNPLVAFELFLATLILTALFVYLLVEFLIRVGRKRTVWLSAQNVTIREQSPFGVRAWWIPVAEFEGIAHYVRSTISDQHHELVLVHRDPGSSILLHVGQERPGQLMNKYCSQFMLPEIDASNVRQRDVASTLPIPVSGTLQSA